MDWKNIALSLISFGIGIIVGYLLHTVVFLGYSDFVIYGIIGLVGILLRKTILRGAKILDDLIEQWMIKKGWFSMDYFVVLKYPLSGTDRKQGDSEWGLKVQHPEKHIKNCYIIFNKHKLLWRGKHEQPKRFIPVGGGANAPIPEKFFTESAKVEVWSGTKILYNESFEELDVLDE